MRFLIVVCSLFALIECRDIDEPCLPKDDPKCGQTVTVGLYYESLCPDSKAFILGQLLPTFNTLAKADPPILNVELVPFGNAQMSFVSSSKEPKFNYTCQHKQAECDGNVIQSCAVVKLGNAKAVPLVGCMFNSTYWKTPFDSAAECAKKLNLDFNELSTCANSLEGLAFQWLFAGQSQAFYPRSGVPFITVNGKHTADIETRALSNLLKLVCDNYTQEPKPSPCNSV